MIIDYQRLFYECKLTDDPVKLKKLSMITSFALSARALYIDVAEESGVPWPVIAAIHFRESDQRFTCHLHNGDPLTALTSHVPAGRPEGGEPPFTWSESAIDALTGVEPPDEWTLRNSLEFMERYNGLGYQARGIYSPYLWDYTDLYTTGLFVSDGKFNPLAREDRPGCVAILKSLEMKGVPLDFTSVVET